MPPRAVASPRPAEPPRAMGLPVITPGLCSPMIVSYSSIIHAMISGVV